MRRFKVTYRLLCFALFATALLPAQVPEGARMSFLENAEVKVGVDLNRGGAVVFLSRRGGPNLINNFDLGRQVQLSFFSGPVPFRSGENKPSKHWEHIGWNPIQAGDDFGNSSKVLEHRNDGQSLYVKTAPLQWPLEKVPGECHFESWLELDGAVVMARARLEMARDDKTQYTARQQELPAAYANAPYHRVVSYAGDRPFTGAEVAEIPKAMGEHPWSFWQGTEGWAALLDKEDEGLGLITPGRVHFTGGFAGRPGEGGTHANSTGYLAGLGTEILDHNLHFEYRYELLPGSLKEIRQRAAVHRPKNPPAWHFEKDRQGWHFHNTRDRGWPFCEEGMELLLDEKDPQAIGPLTFWRAEEAPFVVIECAFQTEEKSALLFWQRHGEKGFAVENHVRFPIQGDGKFHRYRIRLADEPGYRGGILGLRFDPGDGGAQGALVKIQSIELQAEAE